MHLRGVGELSFHLLILGKADDVCGKSDDDDDEDDNDCFLPASCFETKTCPLKDPWVSEC